MKKKTNVERYIKLKNDHEKRLAFMVRNENRDGQPSKSDEYVRTMILFEISKF